MSVSSFPQLLAKKSEDGFWPNIFRNIWRLTPALRNNGCKKKEYSQISSSGTQEDKLSRKKSSEMKKFSLTQKSYITIETKGIVPQNQNKTPKNTNMRQLKTHSSTNQLNRDNEVNGKSCNVNGKAKRYKYRPQPT